MSSSRACVSVLPRLKAWSLSEMKSALGVVQANETVVATGDQPAVRREVRAVAIGLAIVVARQFALKVGCVQDAHTGTTPEYSRQALTVGREAEVKGNIPETLAAAEQPAVAAVKEVDRGGCSISTNEPADRDARTIWRDCHSIEFAVVALTQRRAQDAFEAAG
jgi:hypothetical protein